jgi:MATE family multidrug resistance protein
MRRPPLVASAAPHRAARLAGVRGPGRGARLQHRRHGDGGAHHPAIDLAALAVGASVYISVFVGFMGVVLAIGPIAGQLYGAGKLRESGRATEQAVWLALALAVPGCALLLFPEPFLALARAEPAVAAKVRDYLLGLAFALPPALVFTAYRGFNIAVSRPKAVMDLQLVALGFKVPLTAVLVFGWTVATPLGELRLPALGVAGCGMATAIVMSCQLLAAWVILRIDPFYAPFGLGRRLGRPDRTRLAALLRASACRWGWRSSSRSPASPSWPSSSRASASPPWPATRWP